MIFGVMRCFLNIGNTHTQIRIVCNDGSHSDSVIPTAELDESRLPSGAAIFAASVVKEWQIRLAAIGASLLNPDTVSLDFSLCDKSTIGADRLANACHLAASGPLPAVSLDFGTAITAEVVDAQKRFIGGFIAPGRAMLHHALHQFTSKLPDVPLTDSLPPCPAGTTAEAILAGTDFASVEFIRAFVGRLHARYAGLPVRFVACGGDRAFYLRAVDFLEDGGSDFTLKGIELAFQER